MQCSSLYCAYYLIVLLKAFRLCKSGKFNLSFESITSVDALQALREIQLTGPERWSKICLRSKLDTRPDDDTKALDEDLIQEDIDDDSALTVPELIQSIAAQVEGSKLASHLLIAPQGHVRLANDADEKAEDTQGEAPRLNVSEIIEELQLGKGKRCRTRSHRYDDFESH